MMVSRRDIKLNRLTPNDPYMGRTAPLTSKRCILYIYSTNIGTGYFKHALYSPFFFSLQNAVCFKMLTCLVPVLFTFYIHGVLKLKKNNSGAKGLMRAHILDFPEVTSANRKICSGQTANRLKSDTRILAQGHQVLPLIKVYTNINSTKTKQGCPACLST